MDRNFANLAKADTLPNRTNPEAAVTPIRSRIVSQAPGRVRLRVSHAHRTPQQMKQIAAQIEAHPDVSEVRTNLKTGSIVVHHKRENGSHEAVYATLRDLGIIFNHMTHGESDAGAEVASAFADLNERIAAATDGRVDLRFLVPLGLGTLAVRQLLVKGLQLDIVPWYVLAWYTFDSFIKLHYTHKGQPREGYQPPPSR